GTPGAGTTPGGGISNPVNANRPGVGNPYAPPTQTATSSTTTSRTVGAPRVGTTAVNGRVLNRKKKLCLDVQANSSEYSAETVDACGR
ncbi:hypothetical protein ACFOEZ_03465, partial [Tianweitania populi]